MTKKCMQRKVFCPHCKREQMSTVKHEVCDSDSDEDITVYSDYYIMKCLGGDHHFFYIEEYNTEDIYERYNADVERNIINFNKTNESYPLYNETPSIPHKLLNLKEIDGDFYDLINEIIAAEKNNLYCLATGGLRTAFDKAIEILRNGNSSGSFSKKIDYICEKLEITDDDKIIIETLIDAGHCAIHRSWKPSKAEFTILLEILYSLIKKIVILKLAESLPKKK